MRPSGFLRVAARFTALAGATVLAFSGTVSPAFATGDGPCTVKDKPDVTGEPPWVYTVDLHTEVECFDTPVSVG